MSDEPTERTRYQLLADTFAQAIHQGTYPPGSRLPAIRRCAALHAVSINTVLAAWQVLEDRGLIESRPQSGYFVRSMLPAPQPMPRHQPKVQSPGGDKLALIETVFAAQNHQDYTNIALACPQHSEFFPVAKLARITASLLRRDPHLIGRYALPPGDNRLRQQICRRAMDLGMQLTPQDVTLTHGCMEALQLALRSVTRPGDCVGLETPAFFYFFQLIASLGLKAVEIPTDPQTGLSLDAVEMLMQEGRIQALLAMPTVQNPLGCSMPVSNKRRLAKLLSQYQIPLIEDGLYAELHHAGPTPAVKAFDTHGWVLYCTSFTKTLAPDFRVGWIAAGRFHQQVARLKAVSSLAEPALLTATLGHFLESGGYDHHLRSLRRRYQHQIEEARGLIALHFPRGTRATRPDGGFLLWVELPQQVDSVALFHRLLQENICLTPGPLYSLSSRYDNALRISTCFPFDGRYGQAIQRTGQLACEMAGLPAGID
ncbi:GntR family transcriptional regulator [Izhakiella australiensis]|uniref:GntR family transcriptional regulator n=1 Tax=Izhakiella australiensis TaxID=1926881 RepID=A0A1S8YI53_9GAMM|nr:PLP-dependent aminotransferase family protein [Izhakiella australiensis]OON38507.1 GntR family transcriptional regulator [Izhakiella australiensis]